MIKFSRQLSLVCLVMFSMMSMDLLAQGLPKWMKKAAEIVQDDPDIPKDIGIQTVLGVMNPNASQFTQNLISTSALAGLLSNNDASIYQAALLSALATGQNQSWSGKDSDHQGEIKVTKESSSSKDAQVEVLQDRVQQMPPLEYIGANYVSGANVNLRGGPGTDYKVVDSLRSGHVVHVLGKVEKKDWFVIDQGGVVTGFAYSSLLSPADSEEVSESERPSGVTSNVRTEATTNCKDIEQSVVLEDGTERVETFTACQGPNGWELV